MTDTAIIMPPARGLQLPDEMTKPLGKPIPIAAEKQSSRGAGKIKVAVINPIARRRAIIQTPADMREIRRLIGVKAGKPVAFMHVATTEQGIGIWIAAAPRLEVGVVWRLKDGLPFRGNAVLYGGTDGTLAADFPADQAWLDENVQFPETGQLAPEGISSATNDAPAPKHDEP